ncbi:hypothetical protein PG991_001758 [Apiospora marii]|uniref:Uncharacterized protein n=1 Tax=Apiospora marii TaxID=335849 RepID=A0ABR1SRZ0_9PEZI
MDCARYLSQLLAFVAILRSPTRYAIVLSPIVWPPTFLYLFFHPLVFILVVVGIDVDREVRIPSSVVPDDAVIVENLVDVTIL